MINRHKLLYQWLDRGAVQCDLSTLSEQSVELPKGADWWKFALRLLLLGGTVLAALAVIFFFAYNWDSMARLQKLSLLGSGLILSTALTLRWRAFIAAGYWAMALLAGALLALVGQIYQTGADPWQLFAFWSLLVAPLAVCSRSNGLWLLFLATSNLALWLYLQLGRGFGWWWENELGWLVFFNSLLLLVFEGLSHCRWIQLATDSPWYRLAARAALTLAAVLAAGYALVDIFDQAGSGLLSYLVWAVLVLLAYRYWQLDLYALSVWAGSAIFVATAWCSEHLLNSWGTDALILLSLVTLGLSVAALYWIRGLYLTQRRQQRDSLSPSAELNLWQQLQQLGITKGELPEDEHPSLPWYLALLQGVAGWWAALMMLGFIAIPLGLIFEHDNYLLQACLGTGCLVAARFIYRKNAHSPFINQLALVVSLIGQGLVVWAALVFVDFDEEYIFWPLAGLFSALVIWVEDFIHRVITTSGALFWAYSGLAELGAADVASALIGLMLLAVWLSEQRWQRSFTLWEPLGFALALALLVSSSYLVAHHAGWGAWQQQETNPLLWLEPLLLLISIGVLFFWSRSRYSQLADGAILWRLVISAGVGLLASWWISGLGSALLLLLVGFISRRVILQAMGVAALVGFASWYYYSLALTLLVKSQLLAACALALFTLYWLWRGQQKKTQLDTSQVVSPLRWVAAAVVAVMLVATSFKVVQFERLLTGGRLVLLTLAPLDPRSIMQGDYMRLRFSLARNIDLNSAPIDGFIWVELDQNNVAQFAQLNGEANSGDWIKLRYRIRNQRLQFATNAFFFQEGQASVFEQADFGQFRVSDSGEMLLEGMVDSEYQWLGANRP